MAINECKKCVFGDEMMIDPMPITQIDSFIDIVKKKYSEYDVISKDVVSVLEAMRAGTLNVKHDERGTVFDKIFTKGACKTKRSEPSIFISLESSLGDAVVVILVFHVCAVNNENFFNFNDELVFKQERGGKTRAYPMRAAEIRPSNIAGRIAVSYIIGGY